MASAYYSRNNSYSRSYNASSAESNGRFPRTRAAEYLGLSVKAFDAGCENCDYTTSEWHHVGKYANRIDYYDTTKLEDNVKFWQGARNKNNKSFCQKRIREIIAYRLSKKLGFVKPGNGVQVSNNGCYSFSADTFTIKMDIENDHNVRKGIKLILSKYFSSKIYSFEMTSKENKIGWEEEIGQPRRFFLNEDGSITNTDGRQFYLSQIDWTRYEPINIHPSGGVYFVKK